MTLNSNKNISVQESTKLNTFTFKVLVEGTKIELNNNNKYNGFFFIEIR